MLRLVMMLACTLFALPALGEDLLDTARRAGSFKTFVDAVRTAGLTTQMKADGPFTIFMPTDDAFSQLDSAQWEALQKDKDQLARLLRYHVIPGKVKVTEVKPGKAKSAAGAVLALKSDNGMVTVNGARVTESDLAADNGIIHGIDTVLMPPD